MAKVYDINGKAVVDIEVPRVFKSPVREDLINRAFLAIQSHKRQPYGANILAGKRTSAHYHGSRHVDNRVMMMNKEMARLPRVHRSSPGQNMRARFAPQTVGGREAHPPKVEKVWSLKVNKKENKLAIKSAIAATASKELVSKRGHIFNLDLPVVVSDEIESIKKTKDFLEFLKKLNLEKEIERAKEKKVRAGRGKMRGRVYKKKKSLLIVVNQDKGILKAAKNVSGVNVINVKDLNVAALSPGSRPGRLTLYSKSSIEKLEEMFK